MPSTLFDSPPYSSLTSPEFDVVASEAHEAITARQAALDAKWERHRYNQWSCSQEEGLLRFTDASGAGLEADVQFFGSYHPASASWEWAWNNPHVDVKNAHDARTVRAYGEVHGFAPLTAGMLQSTPDEAPLLMAVAAVVADVEGVFWGPSGDVITALGYRNIRPIMRGHAPFAKPQAESLAGATRKRPSLFSLIYHHLHDPLVLKRGVPSFIGTSYVPLAPDAAASVAPELMDFLSRSEQALLERGFAAPLRVTGSRTSSIQSVLTLIEHHADGAFAFLLISVGKYSGLNIVASIRTDFADGVRMYTSNSRVVSRTPSLPNTDGARFPEMTDVGALYDMHRARVAERVKTVPMIPATRGADPLAFEDRESRAFHAFLVQKGYRRWVSADTVGSTWRGAIGGAWRALSPWKDITLRRAARKAADIRQRLGFL